MLRLHVNFLGVSLLLIVLAQAIGKIDDPLFPMVAVVKVGLLYFLCISIHLAILYTCLEQRPAASSARMPLFVELTESLLRRYLRYIALAFILTIGAAYLQPAQQVAYSASVFWLGSLILTGPYLWYYTRRFRFRKGRLVVAYSALTLFSIHAVMWNLANASAITHVYRFSG